MGKGADLRQCLPLLAVRDLVALGAAGVLGGGFGLVPARVLVSRLGQWLARCLLCGAQRGRSGGYFALQFLVCRDCTKGNNWPSLLI